MSLQKIAAVNIIRRPLVELKPHPRNPREHPEPGSEEWEKLRKSLTDSYFDPLVWNSRNGYLVSGHLRRKILIELGFVEADVVVVDWDEPRHLARMIAANRQAGKDERGALTTILEELSGTDLDLALTGMKDADLARLLPGTDDVPPETEGTVESPLDGNTHPITQTSDIYILGSHRLVCGDCCDAAIVQASLAGAVVDQLVTDPPYGVDYVEKARAVAAATGRAIAPHRKIANDDLSDYRRFFAAFLSIIPFASKNTAYVFMSGQELHSLRLAFDDAGLTWSDNLVWVKNGTVLGRKDYLPKHEYITYGWKGTHRFYGGVTPAVFDDETPTSKMSKAALAAEVDELRQWRRTVIREDKTVVNDLHPTMKPVNLIRRLLLDGSLAGGIVFEPFAGSGTTLIACDQVGRRCRAVEQEPVHCDTIIRRYLALDTTRRVQRIRSGADPVDVTAEFHVQTPPASETP